MRCSSIFRHKTVDLVLKFHFISKFMMIIVLMNALQLHISTQNAPTSKFFATTVQRADSFSEPPSFQISCQNPPTSQGVTSTNVANAIAVSPTKATYITTTMQFMETVNTHAPFVLKRSTGNQILLDTCLENTINSIDFHATFAKLAFAGNTNWQNTWHQYMMNLRKITHTNAMHVTNLSISNHNFRNTCNLPMQEVC